MKVLIQGKHLKVSDDLKAYVYDRLVEPLMRFYDDTAAELRVEFGDTNGPKGGNDKECHLTFRMPGASTIQIEEYTPDAYASLDAASERLIRVCKKELSRMRQPTGHQKYRPLGSVAAEGGARAPGSIDALGEPRIPGVTGLEPKPGEFTEEEEESEVSLAEAEGQQPAP